MAIVENNIQYTLEGAYKSDIRPCTKVISPLTSVENRLGHLDAIKEWANVEEACTKFLNTEAYRTFIKNDYILLIGRTGTGKTTILNRYKYEIENNVNPDIDFKYVLNIDFKPYLIELIRHGNIENSDIGLFELQNNIIMLINLEIMRMIYSKTNFIHKDFKSSSLLRKYFADKKINEKISIFTQAITELGNIYKNSNKANVFDTISVLAKMIEQYKTSEYDEIMNDIYCFLNNNRVLVLIDSMDRYDVRATEVVLIVQSLVEVAFKFYSHVEHNIIIKIALPAELAPLFVYKLPEKHQSNTVAIEWKYKELIKMIAIRFLYYCQEKANNKELITLGRKYVIDEFYENYYVAKNFLLEFLPEKCPTNISLHFDTLAYCIRHTQKKPRQLMKVFNMFIQCFLEKENIKYFHNYPEKIGYYIHRTQRDIIYDTLNMYNNFTENQIVNVCNDALHKKQYIVTKKEIINSLKEALKKVYKTEDKNKFRLDAEEYFEMIKESGLIGKVYRNSYVEKNNLWFENPDILKLIITLFEYQLKERLQILDNDQCVLHPMCYEYFENYIDYNAFVYPLPIDDEEDLEQVDMYLRDLLFD